MAGYNKPETWQDRYEETDGTFDWYTTYKELEGVFREYCPPAPEPEVLMVGCGNSGLSAEMHEAGYRRIVNVDIANSAVEKMESMYADLGLEWKVMDVTAMSFEQDRFDVAVDKGTVDAMMAGGDGGHEVVGAAAADIWRTLRPGGIFLLVSHNDARQEILDAGVSAKHGPGAVWEVLELRKCRLSPQATLINVLRSKLQGRPMAEAFKDPALMQEAVLEARTALKQMAFLEAFRMFKAKKRAGGAQKKSLAEAPKTPEPFDPPARPNSQETEAASTCAGVSENGNPAAADGQEGSSDPRRQPYCWVYVLRKPQA